MGQVVVNKVTNANVYLEGGSFIGQASEINIGDISQKMVPHEGLGMIGTFEIPVGIDTIEATVMWNSFYKEVYRQASGLGRAIKMQVRFSVNSYTAASGLTAEEGGVIFMTVQPKTTPLGTFKQHENVELEQSFNVLAVRVVIGGEDLIEYDATANIYKVNGVDQLATYRANLGQ